MKRLTIISLALCLTLCLALLAGCTGQINTATPDSTPDATPDSMGSTPDSTPDAMAASDGIDYMVLVNKTHKLPDDWEGKLETVKFTNTVGDKVEVEKKAYDAYLELKGELAKEDVFIDLDSARRSVKVQQRIMDDFTKQYGADYAAKTVAQPGYSEHHTGLALDLYLIIDGKDVIENEEMIQYPEIWQTIHSKLSDYGFILRYLDGKEHITGYGYEPWHIRYIDDVDAAKQITEKGVTFEGWLGAAEETDPEIDLGESKLFTEEERGDAVLQIKCKIAGFDGCALDKVSYTSDDNSNKENLDAINDQKDGDPYTKVMVFNSDFHTAKVLNDSVLEPDHSYTDYQWMLGYTEADGWQVASWGY